MRTGEPPDAALEANEIAATVRVAVERLPRHYRQGRRRGQRRGTCRRGLGAHVDSTPLRIDLPLAK